MQKQHLPIRHCTSETGTVYFWAVIPGLYICDWVSELPPFYADGTCLITSFHGAPPDDYVRRVLKETVSAPEEENVLTGEGWVLASGEALRFALTNHWLLEWAEIYLFCKKPEKALVPPVSSWRWNRLRPAERPNDALLRYMDAWAASVYLVDACVGDWPGCDLLFWEEAIRHEDMKVLVETRFHATYGQCEGDVPDLARGGLGKPGRLLGPPTAKEK